MNEDLTAIIRQKLKDVGRDCEFVTRTTFLDLGGDNNKIRQTVLLPPNNSYYLLIGVEYLPMSMEIAAHNFLYRKVLRSDKSFRSIWQFPLLSGQVSLSYVCSTDEGAPYLLSYIEIIPTTPSIK